MLSAVRKKKKRKKKKDNFADFRIGLDFYFFFHRRHPSALTLPLTSPTPLPLSILFFLCFSHARTHSFSRKFERAKLARSRTWKILEREGVNFFFPSSPFSYSSLLFAPTKNYVCAQGLKIQKFCFFFRAHQSFFALQIFFRFKFKSIDFLCLRLFVFVAFFLRAP